MIVEVDILFKVIDGRQKPSSKVISKYGLTENKNDNRMSQL